MDGAILIPPNYNKPEPTINNLVKSTHFSLFSDSNNWQEYLLDYMI